MFSLANPKFSKNAFGKQKGCFWEVKTSGTRCLKPGEWTPLRAEDSQEGPRGCGPFSLVFAVDGLFGMVDFWRVLYI